MSVLSQQQAQAANKNFLRALPLFTDLSETELDGLCRMSRRMRVRAGDVVIEEGTMGDGLYVVVAGELEVTRKEKNADVVLALRGAGDVLGEMSLLERTPRQASVRAVRDSELIVIDPDDFQAMLAASPETTRTLLRTIAARLRSTEALLMSREKLASLGTLAAGLAHELNNPAAAIRRAAQHLGNAVVDWQQRTLQLSSLSVNDVQAARLRELQEHVATCEPVAVSSIASSLVEDELAEWLTTQGLASAWDAAPALAAYGWNVETLTQLAHRYNAVQREVVLGWLAAALNVRTLLHDIDASATAISALVTSVKSYVYLDQAPIQEIDLRESLESTLTMLRHRLKHGVVIVREYAADVPLVEAFGSELNQVWTNLIDNAIDAMNGTGTITVSTRRSASDHESVSVRIIDDGPGIPRDIQQRIFEPFFTQKAPGQGTGLGLHIAHNIVVNHHRGSIQVESVPGRTEFEVTLPVHLRRAAE